MIPEEPLWEIFTQEVITNLYTAKPSDWRLDVLQSGGLNQSSRNKWLRVVKSAGEAYLSAAFACGLFEGPDGTDLRCRLTGLDDANFRSALSECFAVWYFAGRLRLEIEPRPGGKRRNPLEFLVKLPDGNIKVEVKAPRREIKGKSWWGNDSASLQGVLQKANKQFSPYDCNLLVIVPTLRVPVFAF
jgi:hypothetical protein